MPDALVARPDIRGWDRRVGEGGAVADRECRAVAVVGQENPDQRLAVRVPRVNLVGEQAPIRVEDLNA